MITIFTIPKQFNEKFALIQENAIKSWIDIHNNIEIILYGNEPGISDICSQFNLRHQNNIKINGNGTPYLDSVLEFAQYEASNDVLMYTNCDIIHNKRINVIVNIIGLRWDLNIIDSINFTNDSDILMLNFKLEEMGKQKPPNWIDCFIFPRNWYKSEMKPFLVDRPGWDN